MKTVIIGYKYNKNNILDFVEKCEKERINIYSEAHLHTYNGSVWNVIYDRGEGVEDGFCSGIQEQLTTYDFIEYLLSDEIGEFWLCPSTYPLTLKQYNSIVIK